MYAGPLTFIVVLTVFCMGNCSLRVSVVGLIFSILLKGDYNEKYQGLVFSIHRFRVRTENGPGPQVPDTHHIDQNLSRQ